MAAIEIDDGVGGASITGEVFERPPVVNECLFDRCLMERGVHGLAEARMAEALAGSVDTDGRPVDDDAHGFTAAHEEPGFGVGA